MYKSNSPKNNNKYKRQLKENKQELKISNKQTLYIKSIQKKKKEDKHNYGIHKKNKKNKKKKDRAL